MRGCPGEGAWHPTIEVRHKSRPHVVAPCMLGLAVCDAHKRTCVLADFLTAEGWDKIADAMAAAGKARPTSKLTTLGWISVAEYDAQVRRYEAAAPVGSGGRGRA